MQGRRIESGEFLQVRELVTNHPEWSRYRLSRELCALWEWRTQTGQWKDMAARTLLGKLAQRGWITLPERRGLSPNRHRLAPPPEPVCDASPITGKLSDLGRISITEVSSQTAERTQARALLAKFHYLGYRAPVGENLQYVVREDGGRWLAVILFGAAAWKCSVRDQWIGWNPQQRKERLGLVANNHRFLIFPWVTVPHLASWILGGVARRIVADWHKKYGHRVVLLETFVERDRFAGTCYRAANWQALGPTTGRSRQDRHRALRVPVKDAYALPLGWNFREELLQ